MGGIAWLPGVPSPLAAVGNISSLSPPVRIAVVTAVVLLDCTWMILISYLPSYLVQIETTKGWDRSHLEEWFQATFGLTTRGCSALLHRWKAKKGGMCCYFRPLISYVLALEIRRTFSFYPVGQSTHWGLTLVRNARVYTIRTFCLPARLSGPKAINSKLQCASFDPVYSRNVLVSCFDFLAYMHERVDDNSPCVKIPYF